VSPRNWREWIRDILDAIAEIESFTLGMDYGSFSTDAKTLKAVELNLIVIGEAAGQIPSEVEEQYPQIPWPLMRAMPRSPGADFSHQGRSCTDKNSSTTGRRQGLSRNCIGSRRSNDFRNIGTFLYAIQNQQN
jgi:hypothetical protein